METIKRAGICALLTGTMLTAMLSGCGEKKADGTAAALTIGGETVNIGTADFYLRYQQAESTAMLISYGMMQEGGTFWDGEYAAATSSTEAQTYGENMKESVRDSIVEAVLLRQHFGDYDLEFPADLESAAADAAAAVMEANADALAELGTTQADVEEVLHLMTYRPLMFDAVTADVDTEVADEEAAQTTITYARASLKTTDSETNAQVDVDEEQKGVLHTELTTLLEKVKEADDPETDISVLAKEIDNENIFVSSRSYGSDDTTLPDEVKEAAAALEDGQMCEEVIDTGDYYYIVRLDHLFDEEKTAQQKEIIVAQRQQDAFTAKLDEWKAAADVTEEEAWKKLEITDAHAYTLKLPEAAEESTSVSAESTDAVSASSAEESTSASSVSGNSAASSAAEESTSVSAAGTDAASASSAAEETTSVSAESTDAASASSAAEETTSVSAAGTDASSASSAAAESNS